MWSMLFNEDFNVLVIATTQEVAKDIVDVEAAAKHEVELAQALSKLSNLMKENNLVLSRTIANFTID